MRCEDETWEACGKHWDCPSVDEDGEPPPQPLGVRAPLLMIFARTHDARRWRRHR